jgi:hypothetical protein
VKQKPTSILRHRHAQVHQRLAFMRDDQQDPSTYGDWYLQVRNPITVEGLIQLSEGGATRIAVEDRHGFAEPGNPDRISTTGGEWGPP